VIDAAGTVRINSSGNPMTAAELIAETKSNPKYAGLFKASGAGGTGSSPTAGGGKPGAGNKVIKRDAFDQLSPADKSAHIKAGGTVAD